MLLGRKTHTLQALRTKPTVVFAALLLAVLQLTTATHQFDHTASDIGDVCSVCLQLDKLDDIGTADSAAASLASVSSTVLDLPRPLILARRQSFAQPRAPPFS